MYSHCMKLVVNDMLAKCMHLYMHMDRHCSIRLLNTKVGREFVFYCVQTAACNISLHSKHILQSVVLNARWSRTLHPACF